MPFVQGKCENCGGILTVDPSLKAANCPFCGIAYVVQDSINYYNTTIKVESLHADVVNISDESSSEGRLKAANAYMKLGKYEQASKEYQKVSELAPQNYLGWLGLIESHTFNYSKRILSASELQRIKEYTKSVMLFAPNDTGKDLLNECYAYIKSEEEKNTADKDKIINEISKQTDSLNKLNRKVDELKSATALNGNDRVSLTRLIESINNRNVKALFIVGSIPTVIGIAICYLTLAASKTHFSFSIGSFIVGLVFILVGGIPYSILLRSRTSAKRINDKLSKLQAQQNDYDNQLNEIRHKKNTIKSTIQSKEDELGKYI